MSSTHVIKTNDGKLIVYSTSERSGDYLLRHLKQLFPEDVTGTDDSSLSFVNVESHKVYPDTGQGACLDDESFRKEIPSPQGLDELLWEAEDCPGRLPKAPSDGSAGRRPPSLVGGSRQ